MKTIDFYQLFLLYYDFIIKRNLFLKIVETVTLFLTYYMRQKTVLFSFYVYKLYIKIIVLLLPLT